jgi:hypothetical protein
MEDGRMDTDKKPVKKIPDQRRGAENAENRRAGLKTLRLSAFSASLRFVCRPEIRVHPCLSVVDLVFMFLTTMDSAGPGCGEVFELRAESNRRFNSASLQVINTLILFIFAS